MVFEGCCDVAPDSPRSQDLFQEAPQKDETMLGSVWAGAKDSIDGAVEQMKHQAEQLEDKVMGVVQRVQEACIDTLNLDVKFKTLADAALDDMAPKAGDMASEDAAEFVPGFKKFDDATSRDLQGEAREACSSQILGFRSKIHDFCEDVIEYLKQSDDITDGALKCFYKVVSWIMRACKEGVQVAVELLKKAIPDCIEPCCFSCFSLTKRLAEWMTKTFNRLLAVLEVFIQDTLRSIGVPGWICDKVDIDGNASADNATDDDEPIKAKLAREASESGGAAADAPGQETMEGEAPAASVEV